MDTTSQLDFLINEASKIAGSQRKLADLLDLSNANLIQMKNGTRHCNWRVRGKLRAILGEDPAFALMSEMTAELEGSTNADEQRAAESFRAILNAYPNGVAKEENPASANTDGVVWRRRKVPALHLAALEIARRLRNAIHGTLHDRLRDAVPHRQLPVRHAASTVFSHQLRLGV